MTIKLPEDAKSVNPNAITDGIQLPFIHGFFYWVNGKREMSELANASYYGGWFGNDDIHEAAVNEFGAGPKVELVTRMGNQGEYAAYCTRSLTLVPVRTRKRWTDGKSHSQTLCLVGIKEKNLWKQWGPIVITAKGYSTDRLEKAFKMWDAETKEARAKVAPGVPSWFFWSAIGTFGEHQDEMVGKFKQSPITPITAFVPQITPELMEILYVGDETARYISDLSSASEEWATDKKWLKSEEKLIEPEQHTDAPPPDEDDLPF